MEKEKKVKQTIVIRKDLNMPIGKAISQGCHASLGCVLGQMSHELTRIGNPDGPDVRNTHKLSYMEGDYWDKWLNGIFTKITVGCENEKELLELHNKAKEMGIPTVLITDAGLTIFKGVRTNTCIAIGPYWAEDIDKITGNLKLL